MRVVAATTIALFFGSYAWAQQPGSASPASTATPPALVGSPSDIDAFVAKLKADIKPDQAALARPFLMSPGHAVIVEYKVRPSTPGIHGDVAELLYILDGAATFTSGGKIVGSNPATATVEGGTPRRVTKGDVILIPENTQHYFPAVDGFVTMIIVRIPQPPAKK